MHQHHDGEPAAALRDAEFAGDGDRLAVGVAGQELLVRDGQRRDRVEFDPGRDFLRHRLRDGFDARQQNDGAENPGRYGRTHACSHLLSPNFFVAPQTALSEK